jgi:DNA-binding response OmpR family regulator
MPDLDGFEVCRRIRSNPRLAAMAILAVTGFGHAGTEAEIRAAGADDYLEKPFDLSLMQARVRDLLGWPGRAARSASP